VNIAVGLVEGRSAFRVALNGEFKSTSGQSYASGEYEFDKAIDLKPSDPETDSFTVDDVTIGVGFHWQRQQRQGFRGSLRIVETADGLTLINRVELDAYIESVISSEMSANSPPELLKAHAVISRSWLVSQIRNSALGQAFRSKEQIGPNEWEILCWYGKESHDQFDVCNDDHCQRYQGLDSEGSEATHRAVRETAGRLLFFDGDACDARFSKCCGGVSEDYRSAWEDRSVPYLTPVFDGQGSIPDVDAAWIRARPDAYCNTQDPDLLSRILPGFDQETIDFYRWRVDYSFGELSELVHTHTGVDLGGELKLIPLERGASGRISRLRIEGSSGALHIGKELEIRRVLSTSHLYSSAFVVDRKPGGITLIGAGWGHGVGLCQIGAGVMALNDFSYEEILKHYYPGTSIKTGSTAIGSEETGKRPGL
jgi:stage II sporulation protein D